MLHGRQKECALIDGLLSAAVADRRSGVLVLRGEAGIGKSALLRYAAAQATGMRVLRGAGVESEAEFPFAAVHQLLRPVADLVEVIPERLRDALRGAFGLGPAADQDRFLLSLGVLSVLAEAAEERPLLCLVDDAHWLDGASAAALTFAARRLDSEGVVILFAARDQAVPGLPELTLAGLDAASAGDLLASRAGTPLPAAVRDSLVASTAGNPLALLELPGALSAEQLSGRAALPDRLPVGAGVEQVFLDRVRREDPSTQTLLLVAAAEDTGELGPVLRAAELLGVPAGALDAAEKAGLVTIDGRTVEFRHPLVRSAVYRGATFWQRRDARQALAAALDGDENADRRAWHLAAAAPGPDEAVAAELHRTADRARQRGGHAAAATAFERAAALTASPGPRGERLLAAAGAAWQGGLPDRANALLDRVAGPALRSRADHLRGSIESTNGELTTAYAILLGAAERAAAEDPPRAAQMLTEAGQSAWLAGDAAALHEVARRLAALPVASAVVPLSAQLVLGLDRLLSGDTAAAAGHLREVAGGATATGDLRAMLLSAAGAMFLGDDAVAIGLFTTAVTRARSAGAASMLPSLLAPLSSLEGWTGRFAAGAANATEGLRIATETGQDNPAAHLRSVLAWIAAARGREEECRAYASAALAHAIGHRLAPAAGIASWALGLLDLGAGRPGPARDRLAALAAAGPGESHPMVGVFSAADLVEAAVRTGDEATAREALARLSAWADQTGSAWGLALVLRCRGLLAPEHRGDPGGPTRDQRGGDPGGRARDHYFAEALLHRERPFDAARTELLFGEALRRSRRRTEARTHLRAAHETFERLGLPGWAGLAAAELRATGETARKRDPGTTEQLTPQETQIVRIVGEGATNREVAAQMFLSPRTVDYHLRKVFTKLNVSSRAELIRLAARQDG
ncbi:helix-turn-helix transcriptional regulator [Actinoplanes sp. NBRC 103695]|uniref:helix-turn-helix transcriptional regulator n=1 Tax=Actinoplanes sp. NBRC 103695 TaxID=3032202 RepID=UPI0024A1106A|nr:helix-turn-helix transcriptional regulator [Actinoplanes sp. NBRC 103695]GLY97875.1 transcriptional regulator [Actinoplanes sp. NBRC 103695]